MKRPGLLVFLLALFLNINTAPVFAQTPAEARGELKDRLTRTLRALDQNSLEIRAVRKELAAINQRIARLNASLRDLERRKASIEAGLGDRQKRVALLSASLKSRKKALDQSLRAYYLYGQDAMAALLTDSPDMAEALWCSGMLERLTRDAGARLKRHEEEKQKLNQSIEQLKTDRRRMKELLNWQSASINELAGLKLKKAASLAALKEKRQEMQTNLVVLKEAQKRLARAFALAPPKNSAKPGRSGVVQARGRLSPPVQGSLAGASPNRNGVLIKAGPGALVRSPWWGKVAFAGKLSGYGQVVVVDHGQRVHSVLGYLTQLSVEKGQALDAGQTVGKTGPGGLLYLEVRRGGKPQDPRGWMSLTP